MKKKSDMRILITGATGFIGSHVLNYFLKEKKFSQLHILSRRELNIKRKSVELIKADLTNYNKLKKELSKRDISVIINCAGKLGGPLVSKKELLDANYISVKNLVDIYTELQNIDQFIHFSSFGVLGPIPTNKIPAGENYPYNPSNDYEKSKMLGEMYLANSELPYTILRPEFVYGPGDMHLLPFFKKILERKIVLINGGKAYMHPTYIDDLIDIIDKVLLNKKAIGEIFNIGGEKYLTVKEFAELVYYIATGEKYNFKSVPSFCLYPVALVGEILKIVKIEFPLNIQRLKFFTQNRVVDYKKAKKILNYKPTPLLDGLKVTIKWYRENEYL